MLSIFRFTPLFILTILLTQVIHSQTTILNANINEYNVTPSSLSQISISNSGAGGVAKIEILLTNSGNITLLSASTSELKIKPGINIFGVNNLKFITFLYGSTPQADYLKNLHRLSSGSFNYCVRLIPISGLEEGDEICQSLNTAENEQLILVNPIDEEIIETTTPILMWLHSEAFNLLGQGEFFRMTLAEIKEGQQADEAIFNNVPIFMKNYVSRHQVQYPFDAKKMENGKKYAWHVQKIANGNILASTETWTFSLSDKQIPDKEVYVRLKQDLDGAIYYANNNMVYFRFDERYKSSTIKCKIIDNKQREILPSLISDQKEEENNKQIGYNSYQLDLNPYKLEKGYYLLEVENEKKQKYLLNFYVDK